MQLLISRSDLAQYKQMAKTTFDDKLNEQIRDAQLLDLQPIIGESLFNSILAAPETHTELLEGGVYEHDGISYQNYGLKMVLAYFAYARYAMFASVTDTPFSMVEKLNDSSRPAEPLAKKTLYTMNRDAAMQLWGNVKNYLTRTGYSGYKPHGKSAPAGGFRLKKIG
ncbi:hypothetical protein ACLI1A_13430 [Flavobacterium sp. RHBU_3]|uniref:DUF6712 family protein n=1 Tax=Flavobacterium sp. RHBU_3 TaxID=3391184 RepID=UPI003984CE61